MTSGQKIYCNFPAVKSIVLGTVSIRFRGGLMWNSMHALVNNNNDKNFISNWVQTLFILRTEQLV